MTFLNGVKVVTSEHLADLVEDWSRVRSIGRATRRRRQGHRQAIIYRLIPRPEALRMPDGTLVMHPVIYGELLARLAAKP